MAKLRRRLSIAEIFALGTPIEAACRAACARALRWHQWIGTPYPMWDGKKVVYVDPRTIRLPGEEKPAPPRRKVRKQAASVKRAMAKRHR